MSLDMPLRALKLQIQPLERCTQLFADSLSKPVLQRFNGDRGFRYNAPDVRHFCLLKAVRVVSALNASIELTRSGYTQEIASLMRTIVEFTTHIEFVLDPTDTENHRSAVRKYIQAFFEDSIRDPSAEIKRAQVRQGTVHESIGGTLDRIAEQLGEAEGRVSAVTLFSNVYRIHSNYVHGKYPEIMDLYGGTPGRFHLRGMSGTPKDGENLAMLETFVTTASNAFVVMIQGLNLRSLVESDPMLRKWYADRFEH